jgi:CubicO group peptidase (beta-lactamase class C family)
LKLTFLILKSALLIFSISGFFGLVRAQPEGIDSFILRIMSEKRIPGLQVAIVHRGAISLLKSYGIAELNTRAPVTDKSIFAINSCTKAFTGVCIVQLMEEGKLQLDAPVSTYLEDLPVPWQAVTLKQLLTHVSGIPNLLKVLNPVGGLTGIGNEETVWTKTKALPMDFKPGTQFSYNQTNYALLGKIIDKLGGKPFAQLFKERQFMFAGMPGTIFADSRDVIPRLTTTYKYITHQDGQLLPAEKLVANYYEFPTFRWTASGLNSTAEDLSHWLIALMQGKLFHALTSLKTLFTQGNFQDGSPTPWALGWVVRPGHHRTLMATGGGRSAFFVYPDDDLAVIVLTNLAGASPEDFIDELAGFYQPEIPLSDPVSALRMQLRHRGYEHTNEVYLELKKQNENFTPAEPEINDWGYRLMSNRQLREALEIFKLNVMLYPGSWNVYDSYGEALLKSGQKESAILMYKKSIELNPDNAGARKVLEKIAQ